MPLSAFPMTNGTIANTSLDALVLSRLLPVEGTVFASGFLGKACVWQAGDLAPAKRNNDTLFNSSPTRQRSPGEALPDRRGLERRAFLGSDSVRG
jgi:hypothetical protein